MNVINVAALTRQAGAIADRRSALKSLAAAAFVTGIAASRHGGEEAIKEKARKEQGAPEMQGAGRPMSGRPRDEVWSGNQP